MQKGSITHILVIRLSAMGDVAMTVPVLKNFLFQHPHVRVTVLTRALFAPLFAQLERTVVHVADVEGKHKGLWGIRALYAELRALKIDAVADLHHVLRSRMLCFFFFIGNGIPIAHIDKGRGEKKQLTRKQNKIKLQLSTSFERYADVFSKLGFPVDLNVDDRKNALPITRGKVSDFISTHSPYIIIAPIAKHQPKTYPVEKMKWVLSQLNSRAEIKILLLGGSAEKAELDVWAEGLSTVTNISGMYQFEEELQIISRALLMVSMDSANAHLASNFNVPVVSVWGATSLLAGFYPWGQATENAIEVELYCRPCSVFGNKPCYRGDHACMERITAESVLQKITETLSNTKI